MSEADTIREPSDEDVLAMLQQHPDPDVSTLLDVLDALRFYDPADPDEPRLPGTLERDGILALSRINARLTALERRAEQAERERDDLRQQLDANIHMMDLAGAAIGRAEQAEAALRISRLTVESTGIYGGELAEKAKTELDRLETAATTPGEPKAR